MAEKRTPVTPRPPERYIKVSKSVILETSLPEHRISVLSYLNYNQTWDSMVHYSPIYMIQWCSYKPNWRKAKEGKKNIYEKFTDCMRWYFKSGYIEDFDETKFISNTFQSSSINMDKLSPKNNFGLIYDFEMDAIMNYKIDYKPLTKSTILLTLAYVRAFTWIRSNELTGHSESSKKNKPEIFHSTFQHMSQMIGVSRKLVSRATDVLEELGIIVTHRLPYIVYETGISKQVRTDDLIYVCPYKIIFSGKSFRLCTKEEYDWEKELEYGIKYLSENKYPSKKFNQN